MNKQLLRTSVGNRIDERLALGMAREIIRKASHAGRSMSKKDRTLKIFSERGRQTSLDLIRKDFGNKLIGMVAKKGFFEARIGYFQAIPSHDEGPLDTLAIITRDIDLRKEGARGPLHARNWPFIDDGMISALIEVHAIARLIQRGGAESVSDVMSTIVKVASWSDMITRRCEHGSWMIPIDTGLVFAQNKILPPERGVECCGHPVTVIKTFISHEKFGNHHRDAWRRLSRTGLMDAQPKYPTWKESQPEYEPMWEMMRAEGYAWDLRKYHALQKSRKVREDATIDAHEPPPPIL